MIGKVIKSLLVANTDLIALVPEDSIFPYVANENTPFPAIVYTIDGAAPEYTKDGWAGDEITFSVISMADNYNTLQSIVPEIRMALELKNGTIEGILIDRIYMSGMVEGFNLTESAFMNNLSFSVIMKGY